MEILALTAHGYFQLYNLSFPEEVKPKSKKYHFFFFQVKHKVLQDLSHYFSHQLMHNCL